MATPTISAHLASAAEHSAPPALESTGLDFHVNGNAAQHNAIDALPVTSDVNGDDESDPTLRSSGAMKSKGEMASDLPMAPTTDVASGTASTAPFLPNVVHADHASIPQAFGQVEAEDVPAINSIEQAAVVNGVHTAEQSAPNGSMQDMTHNLAEPETEPPLLQDAQASYQSSTNPQTQTQSQPTSSTSQLLSVTETVDQEMMDAPVVASKVAREREDDEYAEPSAKRARTEDPASSMDVSTGTPHPALPAGAVSPSPTETAKTAAPPATTASAATIVQAPPSTIVPPNNHDPPVAPTSVGNGIAQDNSQLAVNFGPITEPQIRSCLEGLKNIRKSRLAAAFQKPVDVVALKIPTYFDIIKQPMDLSTMEHKMKTHQYASVNDYIADFDVMVQNSVTFNGAAHIVSQNGTGLRALLNAQMKRMPRPGHNAPAEPPKKPRKSSVSVPREPKPPRVSRPSAGPSQPPPLTTDESFALDADGMPQIRRHSSMTDGRPKREIHKPPPKDLPYSAKPKKKKYQLELKFCQEQLDEITRPIYVGSIAGPFMHPVDPVALNIPNYRSVIKKPMDLSTVREKLQTGNYENAKEFEADVKLIFSNCYKFNGKEHPISKHAAELEGVFDQQMQRKSDWLMKHAPPSAPQSPDGDSEAEDDEEEEEEDDEEAQRQAQLSAVHAQFAQLSAQLLALQNPPPKRAKAVVGKKAVKPTKPGPGQAKRKTSMSAGASLPIRSDKKTKNKASKTTKPVTTVQKEEISEKIGLLTVEQMGRAAEIIKLSLRKAGRGDLADRGDDEMEFEIDQIPDEALHELLKLVRKSVPSTSKADDNDYRPNINTSKHATAPNQGKARKNKPMKGSEQDLQINRIKAQLNSFSQDGGLGDGIKDEGKDENESSDDDSESGSESEEE